VNVLKEEEEEEKQQKEKKRTRKRKARLSIKYNATILIGNEKFKFLSLPSPALIPWFFMNSILFFRSAIFSSLKWERQRESLDFRLGQENLKYSAHKLRTLLPSAKHSYNNMGSSSRKKINLKNPVPHLVYSPRNNYL